MKLENNWRQKTLENLEESYWGNEPDAGYLIKRCHELRQIPLTDFTTEDLRIMIGQEIGLDYLVPLALETLSKDLFAEGHFYEGDLLKYMLEIDTDFWNRNKTYWMQLESLIKNRMDEINAHKFDSSKFYNAVHTS